jgi:hypothetical protein
MEKSPRDIRKKVEYLLIFSTGSISLIIAILDLSGLLDSNSWVAQRVPSLTLLAVGFVASYLILERQGKIDVMADTLEKGIEGILQAIANSSTNTIKALDGVEVISFPSSAVLLTYASKRFRKATRIDDITWGWPSVQPRSRKDIEAYRGYQETKSNIVKSPKVIFREVVVFRSKEHFEQEKELVLNADNVAYNLGYYEVPAASLPPRIGFAVIDGEEVLFSYSRRLVWLSIKHPDVAKYFSSYFEDIWENSKKLKQSNHVNHPELGKIEAEVIPVLTDTGLE